MDILTDNVEQMNQMNRQTDKQIGRQDPLINCRLNRQAERQYSVIKGQSDEQLEQTDRNWTDQQIDCQTGSNDKGQSDEQ